jgi:hypothetical protein
VIRPTQSCFHEEVKTPCEAQTFFNGQTRRCGSASLHEILAIGLPARFLDESDKRFELFVPRQRGKIGACSQSAALRGRHSQQRQQRFSARLRISSDNTRGARCLRQAIRNLGRNHTGQASRYRFKNFVLDASRDL